MSNYFRWFGSPEDPFGWYYNLLALMTGVSDASIWIRLPDLVCGIVCWLLLSREVLPRLGRRSCCEQACGVGGRPCAACGVDAVQQRPAARGADRHRRADHLRADRARDHVRPDDAGGACGADCRVHVGYPADRPDRGWLRCWQAGAPLLRILVRRHRIVGTGHWSRRCWRRAPWC